MHCNPPFGAAGAVGSPPAGPTGHTPYYILQHTWTLVYKTALEMYTTCEVPVHTFQDEAALSMGYRGQRCSISQQTISRRIFFLGGKAVVQHTTVYPLSPSHTSSMAATPLPFFFLPFRRHRCVEDCFLISLSAYDYDCMSSSRHDLVPFTRPSAKVHSGYLYQVQKQGITSLIRSAQPDS